MKTEFHHVFIIAVFVLNATTAFAESTQVMLSACRSLAKADVSEGKVMLPEDFRTGLCWGAFAVVQEVIRHADQNGRRIYSACAPAESTRTQLITVFVDYAEKNPQRLHEDFFKVAKSSLQASFPCKTGR